MWVRELFANHDGGFFNDFNRMLRNGDPELFHNFVRMDAADFDYLVNIVTPFIKKEDTNFRRAISPAERLAITLRFLATGDSYASLMYLFRVSEASISLIVEETCAVLYEQLKDEYLKVSE